MGNQESTITKETIRKDAERISQMHSWYKHLMDGPQPFLIAFERGEQVRHPINPQVKDSTGLHLRLYQQRFMDPADFASLDYDALVSPVVLSREFCGYPEKPEHAAEIKRQAMIKDIVCKACFLAEKKGILL